MPLLILERKKNAEIEPVLPQRDLGRNTTAG